MTEADLRGDAQGRSMAAPLALGQALGRLIPPGPVLELCCGLGGLTRGLAQRHPVLAVDKRADRLAQARDNLDRLGLAFRVSWLCCDLERPALLKPPPAPFAACLLDPDWSPPGAPPWAWTHDLQSMRPPVPDLLEWALAFSPRLALRLPPGWDCADLAGHLPCRRLEAVRDGRLRFVFLLLGQWPGVPAQVEG